MQTKMTLRLVLVGALAAVACGDSSDSSGDGGGNTTGGGGNTTGGGGGCEQGGTNGAGNCTQKEQDDYTACLSGVCETETKKCLGDDYKNGNYGGVCGTFQKCQVDCDCDMTCLTACGTPSMECLTCYQELSACTTKACPFPACFTSGTTGGLNFEGGLPGAGKTCADLKACCDGMSDMAAKDQCNQAYMAVMAGGDQVCGGVYASLSCM